MKQANRILLDGVALWQGPGNALKVNSAIAVRDGAIQEVGPSAATKRKFADYAVHALPGHIAMPGLINAHCHTPMSFFRGTVPYHRVAAGEDASLIDKIFYPRETVLRPEDVRALAYPYIIDGLRSGVTCFFDSYFFMPEFAGAFAELGVRAVVGQHIADQGGPIPSGSDLWKETRKLIENWRWGSLVTPMVYAHATDTVSAELLRELADYARTRSLPFHMHLSQSMAERTKVTKQEGKSPVAKARDCGALFPGSIVTHLVSADREDLQLVKDSGATAGLTPASEILYERLPSFGEIADLGIPVALGTDCAASNDSADMLGELKLASLLFKHCGAVRSPDEIAKMATTNPAGVYNLPIGSLEKGKQADIVILKQDITLSDSKDFATDLVYSVQSRHVDHVMIAGKWVLWNQQLASQSETELKERYLKVVAKKGLR
jgi:5-methylthioadenosine/S-adenosylhomocysteine deaminase